MTVSIEALPATCTTPEGVVLLIEPEVTTTLSCTFEHWATAPFTDDGNGRFSLGYSTGAPRPIRPTDAAEGAEFVPPHVYEAFMTASLRPVTWVFKHWARGRSLQETFDRSGYERVVREWIDAYDLRPLDTPAISVKIDRQREALAVERLAIADMLDRHEAIYREALAAAGSRPDRAQRRTLDGLRERLRFAVEEYQRTYLDRDEAR